MTNAYDELLASNVWDKRFDLPTCPMHLNPHIYAAYSVRILESFDGGDTIGSSENQSLSRGGARTIRDHYSKTFLPACEDGEFGRITTFPGSGTASHDDAHGGAFLDKDFAGRCADYLMRHDGSYTDKPLSHSIDTPDEIVQAERRNDYRFLFYLPSIKAHAGFRLGVLTQLQFVADLMWNLWFSKIDDNSGRLLLWLAFPAMKRGAISGAFIDYWSDKTIKKGLTPKIVFQKYYLTECPWFGQWAREDWK